MVDVYHEPSYRNASLAGKVGEFGTTIGEEGHRAMAFLRRMGVGLLTEAWPALALEPTAPSSLATVSFHFELS